MDPYDDFFSDEEHNFRNEKIVKVKSFSREKNKNTKDKNNKVEEYAIIKEKILNSYKKSVVCPLTSMNIIICEEYGSMFDYKTAKCRAGGFHKHKTLTKYLNCCDDLIQMLVLSQSYALRNDYKAKDIIEKRISAHIKHQLPECLNFHVEILLVNLFPLKVSLPIKDLEEIFYRIYGYKFKNIVGAIEDVINDIKSPNLFIAISGKYRMVTCIPTHSIEYSDYGDINLFEKVHELENYILKDNLAVKEEKIVNNEQHIIVPASDVLNNVSDKLVGLFHSFDMNVPRAVQSPLNLIGSKSLYQQSYTEDGMEFYWAFLGENLLLEEKDAYLDVNTDFY